MEIITLQNSTLTCEILPFGATIRSLRLRDRHGTERDVVLGYDSAEDYAVHDGYLGAVPGRYANRIARCHISVNGQDYALTQNDGHNHLHGGAEGFSHRTWSIEEQSAEYVTLTLTSPDGDQGYPAALTAQVTYTLTGSTLTIDYRAVSDGDTVCNLTNHAYFNLGGHDSGDVLHHMLWLNADAFTPTDAESIPTGEIAPVALTPMDFRTPTAIGAKIDADYLQLIQAKGYDHNFCLGGESGTMRTAAVVSCAETGITLTVSTTQPGVQFYTGNYLTTRRGKGGCTYGPRHGFCLETQHYPDSPHHEHFPSTLLHAGETYHETTSFTFSVEA